MATYGPQSPTSAGLAATYNAAAGGGDKVPAGALLHVKNANAAILTVTISIPVTVDGQAVTARTVTVPADTGERFIRLTPYDVYRDPADGLVSLAWSVSASVTFAVLS